MRSTHKVRTREDRRHQRHLRVRHKVSGSSGRPRLVVFRSSKHIYAQIVDDTRGVTLVGAADRSEGVTVEGKGKTARSFALGQLVARKAKEKGITKVVFDRGGYQYHARQSGGRWRPQGRIGVLMATDQERVVPPAAAPAGTPGMGEEAETAHAGGEAAAVQERPPSGG